MDKRCSRCGKLKRAEEFPLKRDGTPRLWCWKCRRKRFWERAMGRRIS